MIKGIINEADASAADVVIISAPYEKTASSHKGTINGPARVVECLNSQIEFFDREFKTEIIDHVKTAHIELAGLAELSPEENLKKINTASENAVNAGKFVFLLGGEHAVSLGLLQAIAKKHDPKEVTILQIDAHCDLRNDDSDYSDTPSHLAHSTIMRRASELGYPIVAVGIRTYSREEYEYFSNPGNKVTVFEWGVKKHSVAEIIESIKTKYIYITIDVDGFDPAHMPGTGTAVQGGLEWWYGVELLIKAIKTYELVAADIVEVSPQPETVLTEYGAAQLVYTIIANKFRDRLQK